jgi:hypothetical protein
MSVCSFQVDSPPVLHGTIWLIWFLAKKLRIRHIRFGLLNYYFWSEMLGLLL